MAIGKTPKEDAENTGRRELTPSHLSLMLITPNPRFDWRLLYQNPRGT